MIVADFVTLATSCFLLGMCLFVPIWFLCWALKKIFYSFFSWLKG